MRFKSLFSKLKRSHRSSIGKLLCFPLNFKKVYVHKGGRCDQKPVSVQTIDPSPISKCPSLQLNVSNAPTAYRLCPKAPLVPSIFPFRGINGWGHWIAAVDGREEIYFGFANSLSITNFIARPNCASVKQQIGISLTSLHVNLPRHLGIGPDQWPLAKHSKFAGPLSR